jgi:hypothetical protein
VAILVRPVREQLEHDRLIRHIEQKYKRKHEVAMNVGDEQVAPVKISGHTLFPDLVLTAASKLAGVVEVETGESVHNLEALYQWVPFAKVRVPFHLYVPVPSYDAARRLCEAHGAKVSEIWTYRPAVEGFDLVRMYQDAQQAGAAAAEMRSKGTGAKKAVGKGAPKSAPKGAAKPAAKAAAKRPAKPKKPTPAVKKTAVKAAKPAAKAKGKAKVATGRGGARKK